MRPTADPLLELLPGLPDPLLELLLGLPDPLLELLPGLPGLLGLSGLGASVARHLHFTLSPVNFKSLHIFINLPAIKVDATNEPHSGN